ncbi:unnamed protein product [Fusarium equiseti]|uniref:Uncharacterized protein n=1 Tax=Fusarium equiseti TaxID=61235 RepID=A0A8J2NAM5_FUSEQ|nr:unnamed protein product [Fusarium equiseti]
MPRLRELDIEVSPRLLKVSSTHQRIELARSLAEVPLPTSLHNFTLRYYKTTGPDGFPTMENDEDILSRELRRLSRRKGLEYLTFYGRVEPSIFWPPHSASEAQQRKQANHGVQSVIERILPSPAKCSAHMPEAEHNSIEFNDIWGTSLACTMVSGNRFIELKGKPDLTLELDKETVDEWRKTADVHSLDSEMRIVGCDHVVEQ